MGAAACCWWWWCLCYLMAAVESPGRAAALWAMQARMISALSMPLLLLLLLLAAGGVNLPAQPVVWPRSRVKVCLPCCKGCDAAYSPPVKHRFGCPMSACAGRGVLPARKRRKTEGLDLVKGFVRANRKGGEAK